MIISDDDDVDDLLFKLHETRCLVHDDDDKSNNEKQMLWTVQRERE